MRASSAQRIASVLGLALFLLGVGCTLDDDQTIPDAEPGANVFGLDEDASSEDLYFQALRLHSAGLVRRERMEQLQRQLAVVDEVYAEDPDHELLLRKALLSQLRLAAGEVSRENRAVLEAQEGRAYGRRLHRAGVRAAAQSAEGMVLVAGMLGVPTSKEDALLMVAIPAGGYLVVKIGGMALKRAAYLLRSSRNTDEVVEGAARLGFDAQRVEDASALRTAMASENEALAANFEEVVTRIPRADTNAVAHSTPVPVTSLTNMEVRGQASSALEIQSARNVEARSQAARSTVVEMSSGPRPPRLLPSPVRKDVNQREFSRWIQRAERQPARNSTQSYRYQQKHAGSEEVLVRGGGEEIWADGVRMDTARLVEVKFVSSPETSPFILESRCHPQVRAIVQAEVNDEFRRYAAIISDTSTPAVGLEVIVNDARAVPFLEGLLRSWEIPGEILVRP